MDLGPPVTSTGRLRDAMFRSIHFRFRSNPNSLCCSMPMRGSGRNPGVKVSEGSVLAVRRDKIFANSEGAYVEQTIFESGGSISATAVEGNEIQVRSYPHSFRQQGTGGWEYIADADFRRQRGTHRRRSR